MIDNWGFFTICGTGSRFVVCGNCKLPRNTAGKWGRGEERQAKH